MPYINSTEFGNVVIDDKKYNQVLIIGDSVMERDYNKLEELFSTSHKIGDWEVEELLKENPEIIVIGTGQNGAMEVDKETLNKLGKPAVSLRKQAGPPESEKVSAGNIEVITAETPKAIEIYNEKVKSNKRVNILIHTTC